MILKRVLCNARNIDRRGRERDKKRGKQTDRDREREITFTTHTHDICPLLVLESIQLVVINGYFLLLCRTPTAMAGPHETSEEASEIK